MAFSPDGMRIAAGSGSGAIQIWDLKSTSAPHVLPDTSSIFSLAFNREGTRMVTATYGRSIRVWDVEKAVVQATLSRAGSSIPLAVTFSPDGKWVMAGFVSGEIYIWDAATYGGSVVTAMDHHPVSGSFLFRLSADGRQIAAATDESTVVLDTATGDILLRHPVAARAAAFNHLGNRLAIGDSSGGIEVIDSHTGRIILSWLAHDREVLSLDFNRAGRYIASSSSDGTARIWDASTGKEIAKIELAVDPLRRAKVAFHPTRDLLATSAIYDSPALGVRLWHVPSGKLALRVAFKSPLGPYSPALAFSPDGKRVASPDSFDQVRVSDTATGDVLAILKSDPSIVWSVAFSPDGKLIANVGAEEIRFWDAVRYELLFTLRRPGTTPMELTFSPDGTRLYAMCLDRAFSGGQVLRVWDTSAARSSAAHELVAQLARKYPLMLDVRRHLESDPDLDESTRNAALQIAWPAADTSGPLSEQLIVPLLNGQVGHPDLTTALRRSEAFYRFWPVSTDGPLILGLAQYRNQLYEEAIKNLSRAIAAGGEDPAADAFLAMALYRVGRTDEAGKNLDRARIMLKHVNPYVRRLEAPAVAEAELLLAGKAVSGAEKHR